MREQRKAKGLTMRDLSAISGKPHSYFGKIEQGIRGLDILEFIELCGWLGIDYRSAINQISKL
ncbi:helix-turn-helix transcriptional regulator [Rheinheimera sp. SM2107]|uniref:Helix-turn-helix transcriptional regulator n=1 Tax=Arsukibacterium indicum TaxID=2848612 RepID=A0ABS6MJD5_9GAMM|nr:helix-turn-helix transcriptional regulator [Arsukibacterium indicum]